MDLRNPAEADPAGPAGGVAVRAGTFYCRTTRNDGAQRRPRLKGCQTVNIVRKEEGKTRFKLKEKASCRFFSLGGCFCG